MATYTVIGSDQKQYDSITADNIRSWITDGRLNAQSLMREENDTEFRQLSAFPEFVDAFAVKTSVSIAPPHLPAAASAGPVKTSGMAIASLVLGILGLFTCGIAALIGLILGIIAMVKVKNSGGRLGGNGIALAGVIVSGIFLFMLPFILAGMLLPALAAAKQKAQSINCVSNEKQLALAVRIYSGDNKDQLPPAATWCDAIKVEAGTEKIFKCAGVSSGSRCDYAFNAKLGGMDESKVDPHTVMIFESDSGWNANGGPELMIRKPRHARGFVVAFADGSVQQLRESQLNTLRWDP
jgi:prepilin-type processing-associated H-X9-DG protein